MSFQYINPIYLHNNQTFVPYIQMHPQMAQNPYMFNQFAQNPYSASFYNQSINFPYMPIFQTQNPDYIKLGEIVAPNGELTHLYRLSNGHTIAIMRRKDEQSIVKTFVSSFTILYNPVSIPTLPIPNFKYTGIFVFNIFCAFSSIAPCISLYSLKYVGTGILSLIVSLIIG